MDEIDGLAPAIAIKQKNTTRNPRSTVATATEIYDYMRLLYARCGTMHCIVCDGLVRRDSVDEIAAADPRAGRGHAPACAVSGRSTRPPPRRTCRQRASQRRAGRSRSAAQRKPKLRRNRRAGRSRFPTPCASGSPTCARAASTGSIRTNRIFEFSTPESLLDLDFTQPVFVLVDRIVVSDGEPRAHRRCGGDWLSRSGRSDLRDCPARRRRRSRAAAPLFAASIECKHCHRLYREPEPRLFCFNNPYGACPRCQGFGNTIDFDMNLVIPDKGKTLNEGAIDPWKRPKYRPLPDRSCAAPRASMAFRWMCRGAS